MKRIAVLCEVLAPPLDEGVRIFAGSLAVALSRRVEVAVLGEREARLGSIPIEGVLTDRYFLGSGLAGALTDAHPDALLYVPWTSLTARTLLRVAMLRRRAPGIPVGVVALQPRGTGRLVRLMTRAGRPDVLFATGPEVESDGRALGLPLTRLQGGVDAGRFRPRGEEPLADLRRALGLPASAYIVLHVGHLKRGRGVTALASVQAIDGVQAVLVASTSTGQDGDLRRRLQTSGVRIVDEYLPEIERYYQAADCYLFPVRSSLDSIELPQSVLEAMSCDLPIVVTRFGGLPALLEGAGPGARIVESTEEMPRVVAALKKDRPVPRLRERVSHLTWDAMAGRVIAALDATRGSVR